MKVKLSLKIVNKSNIPVFGNGVLWLLEHIENTGSISQAAKKMNMSYSKALKILNNFEKNIRKKIIIRYKGGATKGGARLTQLTKNIISEFTKFQNNINQYSEKVFNSKLKKFFQ